MSLDRTAPKGYKKAWNGGKQPDWCINCHSTTNASQYFRDEASDVTVGPLCCQCFNVCAMYSTLTQALESIEHRCIGCGHRWTEAHCQMVYCGDCHRAAQAGKRDLTAALTARDEAERRIETAQLFVAGASCGGGTVGEALLVIENILEGQTLKDAIVIAAEQVKSLAVTSPSWSRRRW